MGGVGADLEKICGSRRERRTNLAEPTGGGIMAVGKGAKSGYFGQPSSGVRKL